MRLFTIFLLLIISKLINPQSDLININTKIDSIQKEILLNEKSIKQLNKELDGLKKLKANIINPESAKNKSITIKLELPDRFYPKPKITDDFEILPINSVIEVIAYENGFWKIIYEKDIGYMIKGQLDYYEQLNDFFREEIESKPRPITNNADEVRFLEEIERAKKKGIPILFREAKITFNAIDNPEAFIEMQNISEKTIDAYTLDIHCYNRFGNKVKENGYGDNVFEGIAQNKVRPNRVDSGYWTLFGHETTSLIKVYIEKVHFTDGTTWKPSKGKNPMIEGKSNK